MGKSKTRSIMIQCQGLEMTVLSGTSIFRKFLKGVQLGLQWSPRHKIASKKDSERHGRKQQNNNLLFCHQYCYRASFLPSAQTCYHPFDSALWGTFSRDLIANVIPPKLPPAVLHGRMAGVVWWDCPLLIIKRKGWEKFLESGSSLSRDRLVKEIDETTNKVWTPLEL